MTRHVCGDDDDDGGDDSNDIFQYGSGKLMMNMIMMSMSVTRLGDILSYLI